MLKFLARLAEKYAKSSNTACFVLGIIHQPKMPASMIKKRLATINLIKLRRQKIPIYLGIFILCIKFLINLV